MGGSFATNATRVYAELSGNFAAREPRSVQTGIALSNSGAASVTITIEAANLEGTTGGTTTLSVPARGQIALLLGDIPGLKLPTLFTGTLWSRIFGHGDGFSCTVQRPPVSRVSRNGFPGLR